MPNTAEYIERILRVANIAERTDVSLDELHSLDTELGIDFFDPVTRQRMADPNIGKLALEKLLASLPVEELERIHALMYAGRDGESVAETKKYFRERKEPRVDMERSIAEKRLALRTYFDRAVERANRDHLDINTF